MVVLEDFTKISEGCDVPDAGHVERCPRCGRSGVAEPSEEGTPIFVHTQLSEVIGDGMRVELQDCCAISVASAYSGSAPLGAPARGSAKGPRPRA